MKSRSSGKLAGRTAICITAEGNPTIDRALSEHSDSIAALQCQTMLCPDRVINDRQKVKQSGLMNLIVAAVMVAGYHWYNGAN